MNIVMNIKLAPEIICVTLALYFNANCSAIVETHTTPRRLLNYANTPDGYRSTAPEFMSSFYADERLQALRQV